eukprot:GFYU01086681.1.p1 GENE.GFYU01086681.1~~GFYU01086681.1.p1  ORF type:complete len:144 (+),score=15.11 GFYU01086681.1:98-529(+)
MPTRTSPLPLLFHAVNCCSVRCRDILRPVGVVGSLNPTLVAGDVTPVPLAAVVLRPRPSLSVSEASLHVVSVTAPVDVNDASRRLLVLYDASSSLVYAVVQSPSDVNTVVPVERLAGRLPPSRGSNRSVSMSLSLSMTLSLSL